MRSGIVLALVALAACEEGRVEGGADAGPTATDAGGVPDAGLHDAGPSFRAGDSCQHPFALQAGAVRQGDTSGNDDDYRQSSAALADCQGEWEKGDVYDGNDLAYSVVVPPDSVLVVTVKPDPGFDAAVALVNACGAGADCLLASDRVGEGVQETLSYIHRGARDLMVYVLVDSYGSSMYGEFTVLATVSPAPPEPSGDFCGAAVALVSGQQRNQDTFAAGDDFNPALGASRACRSSLYADYRGRDLAYSITVPAGQELLALVTPISAWNPAVAIVGDCHDVGPTCLAAADERGDGDSELAQWLNESSDQVSVRIVVDSRDRRSWGTFTIRATVRVPPPPPPGEVCSTAIPLTPQTTLDGQDTSGARNDYDAGSGTSAACAPIADYGLEGKDLAYSITVPAGETLDITVTPAGPWDPGVVIVTDCAAPGPTCLAGKDTGFDADPETASYKNNGGAPMQLFVIVDSYSRQSFGAFSIHAALTRPVIAPVGDRCATSRPLVPGESVTEDTSAGAHDYDINANTSAACTPELFGAYIGKDATYSITVPARRRLRVVVDPVDAWDPAVAIVDTCALPGPSCLAAGDVGFSGEAETVLYSNRAPDDRPVFIHVDSFAVSSAGQFTLQATLDACTDC